MPVAEWIDTPERYATVEVMAALSDEQGGGFGRVSTPETFVAASVKMSASESFRAFGEVTTIAHKIFLDLPISVTEADRLYHPEHGELNVRSVKPMPEEGLAILEAEEVS